MPYTANGTTSCVTADTKSTSLLKTTLTWTATQSSTLSTQTWSYTGTVVGATPLPSVANLPTQSVYDVDEQDPKGWTYCYVHGENNVIGSDYVSYYAGSMFDLLYHQCEQKAGAQAPVGVVSAASFLLDETTSYIDSPKTQSPDPPKSDTERTSKAPSSVLVDPFETKTDKMEGPEATSTDKTNDGPSDKTKPIQSGASRTGTHVESDSTNRDSDPTEITKPSPTSSISSGDAEDSHTTAGSDKDTAGASAPPTTDDRQPTISRAPGSSANIVSAPNANPATSSQAIASSNSGNLDALNSLIHEVGQLQSSGQAEFVQNTAERPVQSAQATQEIATASPLPAPIVVGSTTVTANSDGYYMIDTHALQPTESAYENQGVTYSIDTSANALVVDGTATFAIQTALPGQDSPSPANLGSGVATALVKSDADGSSTTRGVGDYVWAGIAGAMWAGSQGEKSLVDTQGSEAAQTETGFAYYVSPINTWTASDGSIVVESTTIVASPPMYPVSTWTASDGKIVIESSAAAVNPAMSTYSLSTASDGRVFVENTGVPLPDDSPYYEAATTTASDGKVAVETSSVQLSHTSLSVEVITSTASDGSVVVESRTIESLVAQHSSASPSVSLSAISTSTASDGRIFVINTPVELSSAATAQSTATTTTDNSAAQQTSSTRIQASGTSQTGTHDPSSSASLSPPTDQSGGASAQGFSQAHVALILAMSITIILLQNL